MMKIRFIKDYRAFMGVENPFGGRYDYEAGEIKDANDETAQWLIDNGFAEKIEEQWPAYGDKYWYYVADGVPMLNKWEASSLDFALKAVGNVFKTEKSAQRFVDYLKAVEIVRHDEGFMKKDGGGYVISIVENSVVGMSSNNVGFRQHAGEFYFDTDEHAKASLDKHRDEWRTILNYDWSKE